MSLLSPLLLLGLIGLALPVIAHFLGRERPRPLQLASRRFVSPQGEVLTHRRQLRDRALLALRLLLLALVVFALSRPTTLAPSRMNLVATPHDAVIVVDVSQSMLVSTSRGQQLARAIEAVDALVSALPAGSRVGLVTTDPLAPPLPLSPALERPGQWLTRELEDGGIRHGSWTLASALPRATDLFSGDEQAPQVIYAIGDGTARGLASLPQTGRVGVAVVGVPIFEALAEEPLDAAIAEHVGLEAVTWEPAREVDPRAVRITGRVRRHAGYPAAEDEDVRVREVGVELEVAGTKVGRTQVSLAGFDSEGFSFVHTLSPTDGPVAAAVSLALPSPDPLPGDDRFPLWIAAQQRIQVIVVNGDPSELRAHDEVFFLATALHSVDAQHAFEIHGRAPEQLEQSLRDKGPEALAEVDVLILANVAAFDEDVMPALRTAVEAGLGLWVTVGDRVTSDAYNDRFGGLLPLRLREPMTAGTAPGQATARSEGMAPADLAHPALQGLESDLGVAGTQTRRLFLLEPDPEAAHEVALSFQSGAPALLTHEVGRGRVALLATSIDRDWSDLPLRPGFVPLAERTIDYLAGGRRSAGRAQLHIGDVRVTAGDAPVLVIGPDQSRTSIIPDDDEVLRFDKTHLVGTYRVERDGQLEDVFSVVSDRRESVLSAPSQATGAGRPVGAGQSLVRSPKWRWLVLLGAVALAIEAVIRRRRAS